MYNASGILLCMVFFFRKCVHLTALFPLSTAAAAAVSVVGVLGNVFSKGFKYMILYTI